MHFWEVWGSTWCKRLSKSSSTGPEPCDFTIHTWGNDHPTSVAMPFCRLLIFQKITIFCSFLHFFSKKIIAFFGAVSNFQSRRIPTCVKMSAPFSASAIHVVRSAWHRFQPAAASQYSRRPVMVGGGMGILLPAKEICGAGWFIYGKTNQKILNFFKKFFEPAAASHFRKMLPESYCSKKSPMQFSTPKNGGGGGRRKKTTNRIKKV